MDERIDTILGFLYLLTAAVSIGAAPGTGWLGFDFTRQLTTIGPFILDVATVGSAVALLGAWYLNRPQLGNLSTEYTALLVAAVAVSAYGAVNPGFANSMEPAVQFVLLGITTGGYWTLAHE